MNDNLPIVVIVGGGFGGISAAKALRKAPVRFVLIDRTNHHVFQPLLYQVATSVLTPGQIAWPIRSILRKQRNTTVLLGKLTGVDKQQKLIFADKKVDDNEVKFLARLKKGAKRTSAEFDRLYDKCMAAGKK